MTSSVFTATNTAKAPAVRPSPLAEWDNYQPAVKALQARFSLRGNDNFYALNRVLWLAIVNDDATRVRVLRGKLQFQYDGGLLDFFDEHANHIGVVDPAQVVGWCSDTQASLEASCEDRLDRIENEINENWLLSMLHQDALRSLSLAA